MGERRGRQQGDPERIAARTARRSNPQNLSQSLRWFATAFVFGLVGHLLVNAISARGLGPSSYGDFVTITTAGLVAGQVALVGVHRSGLREAARVSGASDSMLIGLRDDVAVVERLTLVLAAAVAGIGGACLVGDDPVSRSLVGGATGVLTYGSGAQQLWGSYLRGFGDTRFAGLLEGRSGGPLVALAQAAFLGVVLAVSGSAVALEHALLAVAAGYALPTVVARRRVVRRWRGLVHTGGARMSRLRAIIGRNAGFIATALATQVNQYVDLWIAALVLSAHDSSLFSAGFRLAMLLSLAVVAIQVAFAPAVSRLWARGDKTTLEQLLRTGATLAAGLLLMGWLPLVVAPGAILDLVFGADYTAASGMLIVLTVGAAVNVLTGLCGTTLMMGDREGVPAIASVVTVLCRIVFGILAASYLGAEALAMSSAVLTTLFNLALVLAAYRLLGLRTWPTLRPRIALLSRTRG